MAKEYRLGPTRKAVNVVIGGLLKLGVPAPGKTSYLMTTKGRRSGLDRTTPVNLVESDGEQWLVSPYGDVSWVHNLRADATVRLSRGKRQDTWQAEEVDATTAAPILRLYIDQVRITAPFFDAKVGAPVEEFAAEAGQHPVFRLTAAKSS
jgi:deazaflavin-dependent oxidoreductase (nitroreductase family)